MTERPGGRFAALGRVLRPCRLPAILAAAILSVLSLWAVPRQVKRAHGVYEWDSSNWQAIAPIWWEVLLLVLAVSVLTALVVHHRGWLFATANAARFIAASALLHCLGLLSLWGVPLAKNVVERAEEIRVSELPPLLLDDNPRQAPEDRRMAFEKVAEPKPIESAPLPQAVRQMVAPPRDPEAMEKLTPTVPLAVARTLPAERLLFVPPKDEPAVRPVAELPRRGGSPREAARPPVVVADPAPAEKAPAEKPLAERAVGQEKQEAMTPAPAALELPRRGAPVVPGPVAVEVNPAAQAQPEVRAPAPPIVDRRQAERSPAQVDEKIDLVKQPEARDREPGPAAVSVGRSEPAGPPPIKEPERVSPQPVSPRGEKLADALQPRPEVEAPRLTPVASLPGRTSRTPARPSVEPIKVDPGPEVKPDATASEKPVGHAEAGLPRTASAPPEVPLVTPEKPTGPRTPDARVIAGKPNDRLPDTSPILNPVASPLTRQPARGTRVARAEDLPIGPFQARQEEVRKESVAQYGGTKESEAAVERGLDWLAAHQCRDGSWSLNAFSANCKHPQCTAPGTVVSDPAGTGLALLPFLAAGNTPKSGKHQQTVARAVTWLIEHQRADGGWLWPGDGRPMYGHALAAIALCEAYGMTKDERYRGPAQKALDFIARAQHPQTGGWRYQPNTPGDTSVAGWQVMALRSGEMAGLSVAPQTLEGARRWLKSVEANTPGGGQFGYQNPTPTPAMTAQGLLCLQLLGTRRDDRRMQAGADYLLRNLPRRDVDTSYYWYHATQVMYHMQGKYWKAWNDRMRDLLVSTQVTKGPMAGSWDPVDQREKAGGRVCSTALRLLMLEVYYRHLPLYQQLEK